MPTSAIDATKKEKASMPEPWKNSWLRISLFKSNLRFKFYDNIFIKPFCLKPFYSLKIILIIRAQNFSYKDFYQWSNSKVTSF